MKIVYKMEASTLEVVIYIVVYTPNSQKIFSEAFSWMKLLYFDWNFTKVSSEGSNWQEASICSGYGLVPIRWQAIIWTNDGQIANAYMRHSASMS